MFLSHRWFLIFLLILFYFPLVFFSPFSTLIILTFDPFPECVVWLYLLLFPVYFVFCECLFLPFLLLHHVIPSLISWEIPYFSFMFSSIFCIVSKSSDCFFLLTGFVVEAFFTCLEIIVDLFI